MRVFTGARFDVISIIVSNPEWLQGWEKDRLELRKKMLADQRRMSYKSLNDWQRRLALLRFLNAANQVPGLLLNCRP
jgi:hypothetical protein